MNSFKFIFFRKRISKILVGFCFTTIITIPVVTSCSHTNLTNENINTSLVPMSLTLPSLLAPATNTVDGFYKEINRYKNIIINSKTLFNNGNQYTNFLKINNLCIPYSSISLNSDNSFSFVLYLNQYFDNGQMIVKQPTTFINNQNKYSMPLAADEFQRVNNMTNIELNSYIFSILNTNNYLESYPGILEESDINVIDKQIIDNNIQVIFNLRRNYNYTQTGNIEMSLIFKPSVVYNSSISHNRITLDKTKSNIKENNIYSSNQECYTNIRIFFQ